MNPLKSIARGAFATLCAAALSASADAAISQSTISSPGGFVQAGAWQTSNSGAGMIAGHDLAAHYGLGSDFHEQSFSGNSSVQQAASSSSATVTNSCNASAGLGYFRAAGSNAFPNNGNFAAAMANGGWKETFTVSHPALTGQSGFLVFQIRARGTFHAAGLTGSAALFTSGYKDGFELLANAFFNRGNSDPISTDRQRTQWALATSFGQPADRIVDGVVTMAVPITFGQSFTLGIYGWAIAGQRSSGGSAVVSSDSMDFSANGLTWNGIVEVRSSTAPITGYTLVSGSGINWSGVVGECASAGDMNCDCVVNNFDIDVFVLALIDPAAYTAAYPNCTANHGDVNHDNAFNNFDIDPFVLCILSGNCP